jgi:hypothetical protein
VRRERWPSWGDEQGLADLPVGPPLGDQGEHLKLSPCQAKRSRRRSGHLGRCRRVNPLFQMEAAALGEQLDLTPQRRRSERDRRVVGGMECCFGLLPGCAISYQGETWILDSPEGV